MNILLLGFVGSSQKSFFTIAKKKKKSKSLVQKSFFNIAK